MNPVLFALKDENGVGGKVISLTQGETKSVQAFMYNADGTPLFVSGTISEILVKVFSQINQAAIQKTLGMSQVTKISDSTLGCFGFSFVLAAADTASMAANNSGLPMSATFTMSDGSIKEYEFQGAFDVSTPVLV